MTSPARPRRFWLNPIAFFGLGLALVVPMAQAANIADQARTILEEADLDETNPTLQEQSLAKLDALAAHSAPDAIVQFGRGRVLSRLKKTEAAIAAYRQSLALDPTDPGAHYNLGVLLSDGNLSEEAIREYEEAFRLDPNDGDAAYNAGQDHYLLGHFGAALERWRQTQALTPNDWQVARKILQTLHALGLWEEAAAARDNVLRIRREKLDPVAEKAREFCFDQLVVDGVRIFAYEQLGEVAEARPYVFKVGEKSTVVLELARLADASYELRISKPETEIRNLAPRNFSEQPTWRELKPHVISLAREALAAVKK